MSEKTEETARTLGLPRDCALCGEAARGLGMVSFNGLMLRLCHEGESSCYHRWTVYGERPRTKAGGPKPP